MSKKKKYFSGKALKHYGAKKGKKDRNKAVKEAKLKDIKPSLTSKKAKKQMKMFMAPPNIDAEYLRNQRECNHANSTISVDEFMDMNPAYASYLPALSTAIRVFGKEHVHICRRCLDLVIDKDQITRDRLREAAIILYAATNTAVANVRLTDKEIEKMGELRQKTISKVLNPIDKLYRKMEERDSKKGSQTKYETRNLNSNPGIMFGNK